MIGLVFDFETVNYKLHPFYDQYFSLSEKKALDEEYQNYVTILKEKGQKEPFVPYPAFNAIIAIAWTLVEIDANKNVIIKQQGGTCHADERLMVKDFIEFINKTKPDLYIHFNGKNFDVPLMIFKSLFYGFKITHKKFLNLYKFSNDNHYDLKDVVSIYGSFPINLRTLSISLKNGDPKANCSGSDVEELWLKKSFSIIEKYCKTDVDKTTKNFIQIYKLL